MPPGPRSRARPGAPQEALGVLPRCALGPGNAAKDNRYLVVVTLLGRRSVTEAGNKLVQTYTLAWEAEATFLPGSSPTLYTQNGKVFTGRVIATCGLSVRFESMADGVDDAAAVSQIQKALAASDHAGQRFERLADAARAELTRVIAGEP